MSGVISVPFITYEILLIILQSCFDLRNFGFGVRTFNYSKLYLPHTFEFSKFLTLSTA